jgi:predicted MFS family arabinose efflux permease
MSNRQDLHRPLWALKGSFLSLGIGGNILFARYPAVQAQFELSNGDWGWVLFALGLGGLTAFPLNRWLLVRLGSRSMIRHCGVLLGLWLALMPWAPNKALLLLAVYGLGVLVNSINVAANSQAALLESMSNRRSMGRLHATFYLGTTFSALLSGALVAAGWSLQAHLALVGIFLALAYWWLSGPLLPEVRASTEQQGLSLSDRRVTGLGVLAALAAVAEGGVNGWITLYLHQVLGASESVAALGMAVFSMAMMTGRFLTDSHADRWGAPRVVRLGTCLAALSLGAAVVSQSLPLTFLALAITGLGQAATFPLLFSSAGRLGGNAIPGVASMGSGGSLIGPFLLGRVAASSSLPAVLLTVAGGLLAVSWRAKSLRGHGHETGANAQLAETPAGHGRTD